jgi:ubiquinol-cytochrome c reductase cytochrome b subunit
MGSSLGVCLGAQTLRGLLLSIHFNSGLRQAFESVAHLTDDVPFGWWARALHANGASLFFVLAFLHVGRGLYFRAWGLTRVWLTGVSILLLLIGVAFLGYVLPWGQISFWGATVITNLISAVPYCGLRAVEWVWGGFAVGGATLTRFFTLHFLLPFALFGLAGAHLVFLHVRGSSNPLGVDSDHDKVPFHPYFSIKDIVGWVGLAGALVCLSLADPWVFGDSENFLEANPLVTPVHIKPEWYFLFAYAILRAVPNKLGGVIGLAGSIAILYFLPLGARPGQGSPMPAKVLLFWLFAATFLVLTWAGGRPVEVPYILIRQVAGVAYFSYFLRHLP